MITGRQALQDIHQALSQEQQRLKDIDARLSGNADEVLQLDAKRATELQRLARLRLQFLSAGQLKGAPEDTTRAVLALIEARNQAYQQVQQRLNALEEDAAKLTARASELADERQRLADEIAEAEKATQARLAADPDYQAQLAKAQEAERVAAQADAKASQSEEELESKGAAYRGDRLFTYLWERGYGTSATGLAAASSARCCAGWTARWRGSSATRTPGPTTIACRSCPSDCANMRSAWSSARRPSSRSCGSWTFRAGSTPASRRSRVSSKRRKRR